MGAGIRTSQEETRCHRVLNGSPGRTLSIRCQHRRNVHPDRAATILSRVGRVFLVAPYLAQRDDAGALLPASGPNPSLGNPSGQPFTSEPYRRRAFTAAGSHPVARGAGLVPSTSSTHGSRRGRVRTARQPRPAGVCGSEPKSPCPPHDRGSAALQERDTSDKRPARRRSTPDVARHALPADRVRCPPR